MRSYHTEEFPGVWGGGRGGGNFHTNDACVLVMSGCLSGKKWSLSGCFFHKICPTKDKI